METVELSAREKEIVEAVRLALTKSMAELGFPIQTGTVNLDGHVLTQEDIERFNQGFDQATAGALIRIRK